MEAANAAATPAASPPATSVQAQARTPHAVAEPAVASAPPTASMVLAPLRERVLKQIDTTVAAQLPIGELTRQVEQIIHEIANEERLELSGREQAVLAEELANDMVGYGPLELLLRDESVADILVNGPTNIYVERRGKLERTDVRFRDSQHIISISQKIATRVGRRIDESSPMVDARLDDGSRVNIVFPPLAIDSPCLSIRKFTKKKLDFDALVAHGAMTQGLAKLLGIAARCRLNIIVSGGTGSGKTTMLNALSNMIDHAERVITVEDAAELQLQQPHVVRLETRPENLEGTGAISQRDLVRNALRMRPDRIIIGEVRGAEAFDMLQAMNTGHDGSISTIHANSSRDAISRIENMVLMGFNLPIRAIRTQIVGALDLIIQIQRMRDGGRRVVQISEVIGMEGDVVTMSDIATFEFDREDARGRLQGHYVIGGGRPAFWERLEYFGFERAWNEALQEA
ncbi:MAG: CpaF family protein [Rhodospirillales bacterium]|nr:CpaF family protein [Rhodospirillales bacterium]